MDSLKLAEFLYSRIQETIDNKEYITEVKIDFHSDETYGNEYIQVSYTIHSNEKFQNLPYNEKASIFHQTPKYTFSLSTNKMQLDKKRKMLRILEFRHIYESLAAYAVLQFEKHLNPETSIKVKSVDMWPDANYAEKYLAAHSQAQQKGDTYYDFQTEVFQWRRLHHLARESKKMYIKEKDQFNITDIQINQLFALDLDSIRSLLLTNAVPIKIKGAKTIDEIKIHTAKYIESLKKEMITNVYVSKYEGGKYKKLITYLYSAYLPHEKLKIIQQQQSAYLKRFIIQQGDFLQLKDLRIVMANAVRLDQKNVVNVEYIILKTDLQLGQRTRTIEVGNILYILKGPSFLEFMNQTPVKHLSLLGKWMLKRKMKLDFMPFEPDLTKEIDGSDKSQQGII